MWEKVTPKSSSRCGKPHLLLLCYVRIQWLAAHVAVCQQQRGARRSRSQHQDACCVLLGQYVLAWRMQVAGP
jgi:hypothetical protein